MNVCVCEGCCDLRHYLLLKLFELHFHVLKFLSGVQKLLTLLLSEKERKMLNKKKKKKWGKV